MFVPAYNSTKQAEIDYGIKFESDVQLDVSSGDYKHWVFPVNVEDGMYTAGLNIIGLVIPPECNMPKRAVFNNLDLIPKPNTLLKPSVAIDTLPPTIVEVYTAKPSGTYTYGDVLTIIVEFSKGVHFSEIPSRYGTAFMAANASYALPVGLPFLELNSQAIAILDGYEDASSTRRRLSFLYPIGMGEFTPPDGQLDVSPGPPPAAPRPARPPPPAPRALPAGAPAGYRPGRIFPLISRPAGSVRGAGARSVAGGWSVRVGGSPPARAGGKERGRGSERGRDAGRRRRGPPSRTAPPTGGGGRRGGRLPPRPGDDWGRPGG
jgi:hypothetical protein